MFVKQQDRLRKNTKLVLIFEGIEEYFLFKQPLKKIFDNKVAILFTNGDRIRSNSSEFHEIDFRQWETLAITDNDDAGIGIRNQLLKMGVDAFTISDFFHSNATHFEDLLVEEGIYPEWFKKFFSKDLLDEYRQDVEKRTTEELIDFTYELEEKTIGETSLAQLPMEKIIRDWYVWIRQRISDDLPIPKKKNRKIESYFDVVYSIHQNSHHMLTRVKFDIPKLVDVSKTQMFEYLVLELQKRIS